MRLGSCIRNISTVVMLATLSSCSDGSRSDAAPEAAWTRVDALRSALALARTSPPVPTRGGYLVRPRASRDPENSPTNPRWATPRPFHGIELSLSGDAPLVIHTQEGPPIRVHRLGALPSRGQPGDGFLAYENAFRGGDAIVFATERGVEDLLVVRGPQAEVGYEVALPQGWRLHQPESPPGVVQLLDGTGSARLRMVTSAAWDATGNLVSARASVQDDRISIELIDVGRWPVTIDPEWQGTTSMTVGRSAHTSTPLPSGQLLFAGGDGIDGRSVDLYDPETGRFTAAGTLIEGRFGHTATALPSGLVLLAGGASRELPISATDSAELYDPAAGTFTPTTGKMTTPRAFHIARLLPTGKVLLAGGMESAGDVYTGMNTAELYDPATETFEATDSMSIPRFQFSATSLADGRVLVTGGSVGVADAGVIEAYDPLTRQFAVVASMASGRMNHTMTPLPDGTILLAGAFDPGVPSAELYDPAAGTVEPVGPLCLVRSGQRATLLPSGEVLLVGGLDDEGTSTLHAEVFDPRTRTFAATEPATQTHAWGTIDLLPTGKILVTGGDNGVDANATADLYDPAMGAVLSSGAPTSRRSRHHATRLQNGRVLLTGGVQNVPVTGDAFLSPEVYDPNTQRFAGLAQPALERAYDTATLLPSGEVLVVGGQTDPSYTLITDTAYLVDPAGGTATLAATMSVRRLLHTATSLKAVSPGSTAVTTGDVLVVGGLDDQLKALSTAELYDHEQRVFLPAGEMAVPRAFHAAVLLGDGRVLVAGGGDNAGEVYSTAEVWDPATLTFSPVGDMTTPREVLSATVLASGEVLVLGATVSGPSSIAELFDPIAGTFSQVGPLSASRMLASATLLASGKVLVTGGTLSFNNLYSEPEGLSSAELYDPAGKSFTPVAPMLARRGWHTGTLLEDNSVLLVGGGSDLDPAAELFDPASETFRPLEEIPTFGERATITLLTTGNLLAAGGRGEQGQGRRAQLFDSKTGSLASVGELGESRWRHAAMLLRSGEVLVAGGFDAMGHVTSTAERYTPETGEFSSTGDMSTPRRDATLTLLPSGLVLVTGGTTDDAGTATASAELYDPANGQFRPTGSMLSAKTGHGAALLPNGKVLVAGSAGDALEANLEMYDPLSESFSLVADQLRGGRSFATIMSPSTALVAAQGGAYVVDWESGQSSFRPSATSEGFGAVSLLHDSLACFGDECQRFDPASGLSWAPFRTGLPAGGASFTALPNGTALLLRHPPHPRVISYDPVPEGVRPPQLLGVGDCSAGAGCEPVRITSGELVALQGARLTLQPAANRATGQRLDVRAMNPPRVYFVPAAGGPPVPSPWVGAPTTGFTFRAPCTAYHGPGWLRVVVDSVTSNEMAVFLEPSPLGAPCRENPECATGHCADGVCCDDTCAGICTSCLAAHTSEEDGRCAPVAAGQDPAGECEEAECTTGACDGDGACQLEPEGTGCKTGVCEQGSCVTAPPACNLTGDTVLVAGYALPCAPYRCRDAACLTGCRSNQDCVPGYVCAVQGLCRPFIPEPAAVDPGVCSVSVPGSSRGTHRRWLLLLLAWPGLRPRKRRLSRLALPLLSGALLLGCSEDGSPLQANPQDSGAAASGGSDAAPDTSSGGTGGATGGSGGAAGQSGEGGAPVPPACENAPSCNECCFLSYPAGESASLVAARVSACVPGVCDVPCAADLCSEPATRPDDACLQCVAEQCSANLLLACGADPDCLELAQCLLNCEGRGESTQTLCADGEDNDHDGTTDCDDPDCRVAPAAQACAGYCPVPLPAGWIFCDDFENDQDLNARYDTYSPAGGRFRPTDTEGHSGSRSMVGNYQVGSEDAGGLRVSFGRSPILSLYRADEDFHELYLRLYVKHEPGFEGSPPELAFAHSIWAPDRSDTVRVGLQSSDELLASVAFRCVDGDEPLCIGNWSWGNQIFVGKFPGVTPIFTPADYGRWRCIEEHVVLNTPGQSDGVVEFWIDDSLERRAENLDLRGSLAEYGLNMVVIMNWWQGGPPKNQRRWFDDIVIAAERIGCDEEM